MKKSSKNIKFNLAVCGGTFDLFHKGHREFLRFALCKSSNIVLGITSDKYIEDNKPFAFGEIELYETRKKAVEIFLKQERAFDRVKITSIDDLLGPALDKDLPAEAIIVSSNSLKGAEIINKTRKKAGLAKLKVVIQPMLKGEDKKPVSSTRIRMGEIDREGKLYFNPSWFFHQLLLTDALRHKLKLPIGVLLKEEDIEFEKLNKFKTITVGDVVTKTFNKRILHKISVIDFYVGRKKTFSGLCELGFSGQEKVIKAGNPAGFLTPSLFKSVIKLFSFLNAEKRLILRIDGEEDLAVLPFLIIAPLGFSIFYGQPNEGIVRLDVNEKNKNTARALVYNFKILS